MKITITNNNENTLYMNNFPIENGENIIYDTSDNNLVLKGFYFYKNYYGSFITDNNLIIKLDDSEITTGFFNYIMNEEYLKYKDFNFNPQNSVYLDIVTQKLKYRDPQTGKVYSVQLVEE